MCIWWHDTVIISRQKRGKIQRHWESIYSALRQSHKPWLVLSLSVFQSAFVEVHECWHLSWLGNSLEKQNVFCTDLSNIWSNPLLGSATCGQLGRRLPRGLVIDHVLAYCTIPIFSSWLESLDFLWFVCTCILWYLYIRPLRLIDMFFFIFIKSNFC